MFVVVVVVLLFLYDPIAYWKLIWLLYNYTDKIWLPYVFCPTGQL